jgi:hypothetical protein
MILRMSGARMGGKGMLTSSKAIRIFGFFFSFFSSRSFSRSGGCPMGSSSACSTMAVISSGLLGAFLRTPGVAVQVAFVKSNL